MSAKYFDTKLVRIAKIVRDPKLQARKGMDHNAIRRYASAYRAGKELPAIRLAEVDGALLLVDGWHRLAALETLQREKVNAEVAKMTRQDAMGMAALANLQHGLPLRPSEHRGIFKLYVRGGLHRNGRRFKSYREMATDMGGIRSHNTIRNWLRKDFPSVAAKLASSEGEESGEPFTPDSDRDDDAREQWALQQARTGVDQAVASARLITSALLLADLIVHTDTQLTTLKGMAKERGLARDPLDDFEPF